ncbi:hypothetical protein AN189_16965 [Loktanella sp. 3ANDIMAR09]|uniref:hypothetical protein n=1 Tax=Loktanella sp. 3ANDIMAR09 TaxID=1225657 RepID=UPI0006F2C8EE|nr:hypothetical protein [Loktanella sp. 3ANDIMAR09]KQI67165.1 hypothetical protein AN189_16965 [Loktanella sp. 3ANDIMAR09]
MIGRLFYKARHLARQSPRLIHARDIIRPRILKTAPVTGTTDTDAELHVLTSTGDWLNLIWSLKSFYAQTGRSYALAIHGDPDLSAEAITALRHHFPDARVIEQSDARDAVLDSLSGHPRCRRLRETNTLSIKSFDFAHFLNSDRMILFDSDLLFFDRPTAFLDRLDDRSRRVNAYNADVDTAYAVDIDTIRAHGFDIVPQINSGFGLVHRDSLNLDWMEEFLGIPGMMEGHFWRIEQTLFALSGSRFGAELLPEDYRVFLQGDVGDKPYRHYVGAVRNQMYTEGMRRLQGALLAT